MSAQAGGAGSTEVLTTSRSFAAISFRLHYRIGKRLRRLVLKAGQTKQNPRLAVVWVETAGSLGVRVRFKQGVQLEAASVYAKWQVDPVLPSRQSPAVPASTDLMFQAGSPVGNMHIRYGGGFWQHPRAERWSFQALYLPIETGARKVILPQGPFLARMSWQQRQQAVYTEWQVSGSSLQSGEELQLSVTAISAPNQHTSTRLPVGPIVCFQGLWPEEDLEARLETWLQELKPLGFTRPTLWLHLFLRLDHLVDASGRSVSPQLSRLVKLLNRARELGSVWLTFCPLVINRTASEEAWKPLCLRMPNKKLVKLDPIAPGSGAVGALVNPTEASVVAGLREAFGVLNAHVDAYVLTGLLGLGRLEYQGPSPATAFEQVGSLMVQCAGTTPVLFQDLPRTAGILPQVPRISAQPVPSRWSKLMAGGLPNARDIALMAAETAVHAHTTPHVSAKISLRPRDKDFQLSENERFCLLIAQWLSSAGLVISDSLPELQAEALQTYRALWPHREVTTELLHQEAGCYDFQVEARGLLYRVLLNLSDQPVNFAVPPDISYYDSFADDWLAPNSAVVVEPRDGRIFLLVNAEAPTADQPPQVAGSTVHLFPGLEVELLAITQDDDLVLERHPQSLDRGHIWLRLPAGEVGYRVNGLFIRAQQQAGMTLIRVDAHNCPIRNT